MAQEVIIPSVKPDHLSSILGTHMVGEKQLLTTDLHVHTMVCTHTHVNTRTHTQMLKNEELGILITFTSCDKISDRNNWRRDF